MAKVRTPRERELAKLRADFLNSTDFHPYQSCAIKFSDGYIGNLERYRIDADKRQVIFNVYNSGDKNGNIQTLPESVSIRGVRYEIILNKVAKPDYSQQSQETKIKPLAQSQLEKKVETPSITETYDKIKKRKSNSDVPAESRKR